MISPHIHNRSGKANGGFTLVELMVSMAIFVTVLSGVTLLFNSAVRTSKQGFQNQEAYEIARGVFNLIERDLSRMYIAREMGHQHTFYGTPYGFTFIGMITSDDGSTQNIARFTYVIHKTKGRKTLNAVVSSDNENQTDAQLERHTYSLLRYVEPGVDSLDSFPVDWKGTFPPTDIGINNVNMETLVGNVFFGNRISNINGITLNLLVDASTNEPLCDEDDQECFDEIVRAGKRELWIRMMAGDEDFGSYLLPDIWANLGKDPEDYVVAENLLFVEQVPDIIANTQLVRNPKSTDLAFNLNHIAHITYEPILGSNSINSTYSEALFNEPRLSPTDYFFAYRTIGERNRRNDLDPTVDYIAKVNADGARVTHRVEESGVNRPFEPIWETEFAGIDFGYWNDFRNLEYARVTSRIESQKRDTLGTTEDQETINEKLNQTIEDQFTTAGSPMGGDTPEAIIVNLTLFFESVYPGAPDFQRSFTQIFDVPAGFKRSKDSLSTQLVRRPE